VTSVTPWWDVLRLRDEVLDASGAVDDVQMSLFEAVHGTGGGAKPLYADAAYYGQITHPSPRFVHLMAQVAVRLGGGKNYAKAPGLWRLDQAMGGGKSHGLIGLWHLASSPTALARTDIGRAAFDTAETIAGKALPADLGRPHVVVMSCDNMTAGKGDDDLDGPATNLYERFLWRLFSADYTLYDRYRQLNGNKIEIIKALKAVNRPVLVLVDEVMDYIRQLDDSEKADLAVRDAAFLRALLDAVNDVPHVAMVMVMIASEHDSIAVNERATEIRAELESLLIRNAKPATINDNTDFAAILQRRLFANEAPDEVLDATAKMYAGSVKGQWQEKAYAHLPGDADLPDRVRACYPFHPQLVWLAEQEWANLAGYQRVRSTIRIFASAVYAQRQRGKAGEWTPVLIGAGDLPLADTAVREAIIGSGLIVDPRAQANYRQIASTDIVGGDDTSGAARTLDRNRNDALVVQVNPRAAERAATALFLMSIVGSRGGGKQGATDAELRIAMHVPDAAFAFPLAEAVQAELLDDASGGLASVEPILGRGGQVPRYFMSTRQTLNALHRTARASVTDDERDDEVARVARDEAAQGPFKAVRHVDDIPDRSPRDVLDADGLDDSRKTRLIVLDSRRFSLLNGIDAETRAALRDAMGLGDQPLANAWAASAVFAVVNTQRRKVARGAAVDFLAWQRVAGMHDVQAQDDLHTQAKHRAEEARRALKTSVRRAYQHVVYLGTGGPETPRADKTITFEHENQTALDGRNVWAALVDARRALGQHELDVDALLHNVADDYGKPLDEVRDSFWNSPKKPLLHGGEIDLQVAIFEAVTAGRLLLVGSDGTDRVVARPGDVGIGTSALRLQPPAPAEPEPEPEPEPRLGDEPARDPTKKPGGTVRLDPPKPMADDPVAPKASGVVEVALSLFTGLGEDDKRDGVYRLLAALTDAVDNQGASHVQIQVKARLRSAAAKDVVDAAREAGANPSQRDV
jgi:hypothetical protein